MEEVVDAVEEAWRAVESRWEEPEPHARFIALCAALDRLAEAGERYRRVREDDPARREDAVRRIDEVLSVAMRKLQVPHRETAHRARRWVTLVAFLLTGSLMAFAFWSLLNLRGGAR